MAPDAGRGDSRGLMCPEPQISRMPHVLLVDDDSSLRRALTRTLQHAGFEVQAYASAEALLAAGPVDPAASLVVDLDLPGASGIELKKALDQAGHALPTIFITASEREGLARQLAPLSPVAVLHKPFSNDDLLEALGRTRAQESLPRAVDLHHPERHDS